MYGTKTWRIKKVNRSVMKANKKGQSKEKSRCINKGRPLERKSPREHPTFIWARLENSVEYNVNEVHATYQLKMHFFF